VAFVVAIHEIEEPAAFWRVADRNALLPEGLRLHCFYPLVNGAKAVCLWEGQSADCVGDLVEALIGDANRTEFYEVESLFALGLPEVGR